MKFPPIPPLRVGNIPNEMNLAAAQRAVDEMSTILNAAANVCDNNVMAMVPSLCGAICTVAANVSVPELLLDIAIDTLVEARKRLSSQRTRTPRTTA